MTPCAQRARVMRLHGIDADAWNRYGAGGNWAVRGRRGRLQVQPHRSRRRHRPRPASSAWTSWRTPEPPSPPRYDAAFASTDRARDPAPTRRRPALPGTCTSSGWPSSALSVDRAEVIRRLAAAGIGTSVHFIPLHLHPHYQRRYGYKPGDFPVAERIFERSISLPIWPGMTTIQVDPGRRRSCSRRWPARLRSSTDFIVGRCFGCAVQRRWYRTGRIRCASSSASLPNAATHPGQATAIGGTAAARTG